MRPNLNDGSWVTSREPSSRKGKLTRELKSYEDQRPGKKNKAKPFGAVINYNGWQDRGFSFTHWYPSLKARDNALRSSGGTLRSFKVLHIELIER